MPKALGEILYRILDVYFCYDRFYNEKFLELKKKYCANCLTTK